LEDAESHLSDIEDGSGRTEIREQLSEQREDDADEESGTDAPRFGRRNSTDGPERFGERAASRGPVRGTQRQR
jgi:hypothetical protein